MIIKVDTHEKTMLCIDNLLSFGNRVKGAEDFDKQRHTDTGWWRFGDGLRGAFVGNNQRGRPVDRRNAVGWKD